MSTWLMNALFRRASSYHRFTQANKLEQYLGRVGAQTYLVNELKQLEYEQRATFEWLHIDHKTKDPLVKAYVRGLGNAENGEISMAEFYKIKHKIADLKKVRFAENYDGYRVTTDVGGTKQRELHRLQAQLDRNERGEIAYKLWKKRRVLDPQADGVIGNL